MDEVTTTPVRGPGWSEQSFQQKAGRFPLAVEAHVLSMTAKLLPGVTTVTTNARYFSLHGLVAVEAERRALSYEETLELSRRCEVVFALAAASLGGGVASRPHGIDRLQSLSDDEGPWNLENLSQPGNSGYSDATGGFRGPYIGSELTLGIRSSAGVELPGDRLDRAAVRGGLAGLLDVAHLDEISKNDLTTFENLSLDPVGQPDAPWLTALLLGENNGPSEYEATDLARRQTAQLLLESVRTHPAKSFDDSFITHVAYGVEPSVATDHTAAWQGTLLRWFCVGAWRKLWSWLVDRINGFTPVSEIGDALADELGGGSVADWMSSLPNLSNGARLATAEADALKDYPDPISYLSVLMIAGQRVEQLEGRTSDAFIGRSSVLGPKWINERAADWGDKSLRDFAHFLVEELFRRSQRIAQKKAYLDRDTGKVTVPTRVHVDEGFAWRDSAEGAADVGLRVTQFGGMLASLGLFARNDGDIWVPTDLAWRLDG